MENLIAVKEGIGVTEILKFLEGNPWLNLVFLVLAILSLLASFYLYFLGKKERRPVYNLKSFTLINEKISKISSLNIPMTVEV